MTKKFAFYGRVSTEDQQDPTSSKQWQVSRALALIEPHGGVIVREFFDVGQSRSLPWKRREQAPLLLEALKDPGRGFEAVVIGEPARAFSGAQFQNTFPLFDHYGVELWVPDVGGYVDPDSDGPAMMMAIYGTMSDQERNRIKLRVRSAMTAQAKNEGRFLGGRPPYGYVLGDAGPHPNPSKAADGKRLHRLAIDPTAAPIVERIFAEYTAGKGYFAIAQDLTRDGIPSPSAHDPARNRHRDTRSWSKIAVKSILQNPRYVGRQVWNRQRRDEVLVDVEDVAAGYESRMRWNDSSEWVWSSDEAHEAIISPNDFAAAAAQMAAGMHRPGVVKRRRANRTYVLSGRVHCALCDRRMQGSANHGHNHYRCKFTSERGPIPGVEHPKNVYVRESVIVPKLDEWIGTLFDPANLSETSEALAAAGGATEADHARIEAAERKLADCDTRLTRHRAALEAGADPVIVAEWMREVQGERLRAEQEIVAAQPSGRFTAEQVRTLVETLSDVVTALAEADPRLKQQVYEELGISVIYDPDRRVAKLESRPPIAWAKVCVGGGT